MSLNISLSKKVLETLAQVGVRDILFCAGSRNSPLILSLEKTKGVKVWNFFEERSAGFFALSLAQKEQRPVAVITTSGTAVAELIPSAVEATYTQTPVIYVTADRPRSYRNTGAPQSIEQVGIFSHYVETCKDVASLEDSLDLSMWTRKAPLQLNVCFGEPLIDGEISEIDFESFPLEKPQLAKIAPTQVRILDQPLVIAGSLSRSEAKMLTPFLERFGAPIYAEATSNLLREVSLKNLFLRSGDRGVRKIFDQGLCQSVLRIGGVPTLRFWRDLEEAFQKIPVHSVSESDYTGLSRHVRHLVGYQNMALYKFEFTQDQRTQVFALDQAQEKKLRGLIEKFPQSEVALLNSLYTHLKDQNVYVGNSQPIRELDLVSLLQPPPARVWANRGANGIDGQLSSFLGQASNDHGNWCVVGDLTALYDLSALWVTPQMEKMDLRIVVINNQGGQIFKNMYNNSIFLNQHQIEFSAWAKMWNWAYEKWDKIPMSLNLPSHVVIELTPSAEQTDLFWQEYKSL